MPAISEQQMQPHHIQAWGMRHVQLTHKAAGECTSFARCQGFFTHVCEKQQCSIQRCLGVDSEYLHTANSAECLQLQLSRKQAKDKLENTEHTPYPLNPRKTQFETYQPEALTFALRCSCDSLPAPQGRAGDVFPNYGAGRLGSQLRRMFFT